MRAAYAAKGAVLAAPRQAPGEPVLDPATQPGPVPSPTDVAAYVTRARLILAEPAPLTEQADSGLDHCTAHGARTEEAVRAAGQAIATRAHHLAAADLAEHAERWASLGVTDDATYAAHLARRLREATDTETATDIRSEQGQHAAGSGRWNAERLHVLARGYRAALAEQRPLGAPGALAVHPDSDPVSTARLTHAVTLYPTSWIEAGNTSPLLVTEARGRAEYRPATKHLTWEQREREQERLVASVPDDVETVQEKVPAILMGQEYIETPSGVPGLDPVYVTRVRERVKVSVPVYAEVSLMTLGRDRIGWAGEGETDALHEYAHHLEHALPPTLTGVERAFLARRTTSTERHPLVPYLTASETTTADGAAHSSEAEWVRPDSFADPYIGKQYASEHTEVLSMGVEALFTGRRGGLVGQGGFKADLEHRDLTLGLLATI